MTATHLPFPSPFDGARGALNDYDAPAATIVHGLTRPVREVTTWGPGRSLFWSLVTLGLGPALAWALDFQRFAAAEREQLLRLSEWVRARVPRPDSGRLREAAARMGAWQWLGAVPAGAICFAMFLIFSGSGVNQLRDVLHNTFLFHRPPRGHSLPLAMSIPFVAWNAGLTLAYIAQAAAVYLHRQEVSRFVTAFNHLAVAEGVEPVRRAREARPGQWGWLVVVGILLLGLNSPWGVAMAVAGFERRQYALRTAPAMRAALARAVTDLVVRQAPAAKLAVASAARCPREGCGAPVADDARFCRRCGAALAAAAVRRFGAGGR